MAYHIWTHAANVVLRNIERDLLVTPNQREAVLEYVEGLPVRTVVSLLAALQMTPYTLTGALFADGMDIDAAIPDSHPYKDHFMAILNGLRTRIDQEAWFPENSAICALSASYLHRVRNLEEDVGFSENVLTALIVSLDEHLPAEDADDAAEVDDDASVTTATTVPVDDDVATVQSYESTVVLDDAIEETSD